MKRKSWDDYFMSITQAVARRSTCLRRQVGAIAVKDKRILATGYNGTPPGVPHCDLVGCMREQLQVPSGTRHELCRAIHAEQNLILQAALHGISLRGSSVYCTTTPCIICAKMLIALHVETIYVPASAKLYPDPQAIFMLEQVGVRIDTVECKDAEINNENN